MLFLQFECSPQEGSKPAEKFGGAIVNCWIDKSSLPEAEALARQVIRDADWHVTSFDAAYPITEADFADGHSPEGFARFEQAAADGDCYEFHTYPVGASNHDAN